MNYSSLILVLLILSCNSNNNELENSPMNLEIDSIQVPEITSFQMIHVKQVELLKELPEIQNETSCNSKFEYQRLGKEIIEFVDIPSGNFQAVQGRLIKECFLILYRNIDEENLFQLNSYRFSRKETQDSIVFGKNNCDDPKGINYKLILKFPYKLALIEEDTINYKIEWNGILTKK